MSHSISFAILVVAMICLIPDQSLPEQEPSFSFLRLGTQMDNLIKAAGGIKQELISPLRGMIHAKRQIVNPFDNLRSGLMKFNLALARGGLRPVFGTNRRPKV